MESISSAKLIRFPQHGDERGQLVVIEGSELVPFEIKRMFYIFGADHESIRGQHANRNMESVMLCVSGSCQIRVIAPDSSEKEFRLNTPNIGLYIPNGLWREMYGFTPDCVLVAIASTHYDKNEYITDLNQFLISNQWVLS